MKRKISLILVISLIVTMCMAGMPAVMATEGDANCFIKFNTPVAMGIIRYIESCNISMDNEAGALKIVGNPGQRAAFQIVKTGFEVDEYRFVALRVKTEYRGSGLFFSATSGSNNDLQKNGVFVDKAVNYQATSEWQTVVIDYTLNDGKEDDKDALYTGETAFLRFDPFGFETPGESGELYLESIGFFKTLEEAQAFSGFSGGSDVDPGEVNMEPLYSATFHSEEDITLNVSYTELVIPEYDQTLNAMKLTGFTGGRSNLILKMNGELVAEDAYYLAIRVKISPKASTSAILFATTEASNHNISVNGLFLDKNITYSASEDWQTIVICFDPNDGYDDQKDAYYGGWISGIRFDPFGFAGNEDPVAYVDSFAFFDNATAAYAFEGVVQEEPTAEPTQPGSTGEASTPTIEPTATPAPDDDTDDPAATATPEGEKTDSDNQKDGGFPVGLIIAIAAVVIIVVVIVIVIIKKGKK